MKPVLEVCAADPSSVRAAAAGGAARVELCSALGEGGVTPSAGLIESALAVPGIKVHVLIRPRGGDFIYDEDEVSTMCADIRHARQAGVHGVVIGVLTPDGDIDVAACKRMMAEAGEDMNVTFHRAFDLCRDPQKALEDIIALGCNRLLTSGQQASALKGAGMLRSLNEQAAGRLTILAGAGVNAGNAADIMTHSGVHELHASARHTIGSPMKFRREGVNMGTPGADEYARSTTSAQIVADIVNAMNQISNHE
ncbi:MAG: copper homeostasis protein CutC [Muribaculaceae bacterium]|nr:copper homeostasis protein CutC [Muribaculaceae bacterium]